MLTRISAPICGRIEMDSRGSTTCGDNHKRTPKISLERSYVIHCTNFGICRRLDIHNPQPRLIFSHGNWIGDCHTTIKLPATQLRGVHVLASCGSPSTGRRCSPKTQNTMRALGCGRTCSCFSCSFMDKCLTPSGAVVQNPRSNRDHEDEHTLVVVFPKEKQHQDGTVSYSFRVNQGQEHACTCT